MWILFALEALFVLVLFVTKDMGDDAAGRGMARGFAFVLAPILLVAGALLLWGQRGGVRLAFWAGFLVVASPLLFAAVGAVKGQVRSIDLALGRAQFGRFDDRRLNALARAVDRRDPEALRRLLADGRPDFAARDRREHTILGHAVMRALDAQGPDIPAQVECVRVLLDAGAPADRRALSPERTSYAPEDYELIAAVFGHPAANAVPLLDLLLGRGMDPNVGDMFDEPLIFSTYADVPKLAALARHGGDMTRRHTRADRAGWTALMNAISFRSWDTALFFLEHGVRVDPVAPDGQSAATLLAEYERESGGADADPAYQRVRAAVLNPAARTP